MFCMKCGRLTNSSDPLCEDCKAAENPAPTTDTDKTNTGMLSFGKGLASTIIGFGVFIISNVLYGSGP